MYKRGQVTLFLIVGMLVLIAVVVLLLSEQSTKKEPATQAISEEANKVQGLVDGCLEILSAEAIDNVYSAGGGGYADPEQIPRKVDGKACLVYNNRDGYSNYAVSKEFVEEQIKEHIRDRLNSCLNLQQFRDFSLMYKFIDLKVALPVEVISGRKTLDIDFDYNINITKGIQHAELSHSRFTVQSNLAKIIKITSSFITGDEAGALNTCSSFLPCEDLGRFCNAQGNYNNVNCEGIQISYTDSFNREYSLIDDTNGKLFRFSICR
ncbi:hypothetical protein HYX19_03955 [Candidatus Woesearchaeota archaeon]|nr:hypothetical protein [Candidatus Woesearchaeota archaeon]